MQWRGVRRPSVCLSVNFLRKSLFYQANSRIATKLAHDGLQMSLHPGCAQVRGRGERSRDTSTFGISQKLLTQSFPNFSFPLSVRFSSSSQSPKWLWVCAVSSAIAHMVKQFVRLFAIQYGLTFCLYVRSLYETPLHSPSRLSRQLDIISKSWNELLHHWRPGLVFVSLITLSVTALIVRSKYSSTLPQIATIGFSTDSGRF